MAIEGRDAAAVRDRLRLGMVGGGQGAFIGAVHRLAARMDDRWTLVAGAFSADPDRARASAAELGVAPDRAYADFGEMARAEAGRPDGIDAVAIVTPNHLHAAVAEAFLDAGIAVICDKPLTTDLAAADRLAAKARETGQIFAVTYNYTGYPMIRQAADMVAAGDLGPVRVVQVEYPQDWLTEKLEATGQKQASWRTDPERAGAGGAIGDIGTHAYHLACTVLGDTPERLLADLSSFVDGRALDDNAHVLLRWASGARGMLWASQVAPGNENALRLRVYGARGGLEWAQEQPNHLWFTPFGEPTRRITRAGAGAYDSAGRVSRIPAGHPEGYLEGFGNLYAEIAAALTARKEGRPPPPEVRFPTVEDGRAGVAFIEAVVASSRDGGRWTAIG